MSRRAGPDLNRGHALAHVDLEFVWLVADEVVLHRRAWWMEHWLRRTRAFATPPVVDGSEPVLHVVRDDDEHADWQLLCGTTDAVNRFHPYHALDGDRSLLESSICSRASAPTASAPGAVGSAAA